jgi:hypothetical protein
MKTRNGFVSNSSSSSFVIVGVRISYKKLFDKNKKDKYGDDSPIAGFDRDRSKIGKLQVVTDDGDKAYIGVGDVASSEEEGFNNSFTRLDDELKQNVKETLEPLGLWDETKFGLYIGTVPS